MTRRSVLGTLLLLLAVASGCDSGRVKFSRSTYGIVYDNTGGPLVASVNGKPFTLETYKKYQRIYRAKHSQSEFDEERFGLDSLVDRELLIQRHLDGNDVSKGTVGKSVDIDYLTYLGLDFFQNQLKNEIRYPAEQLAERLPKRFLVGEFDLMLLDSRKQGEELARKIRTKADFYRVAGERKAKIVPTGEVSPESGFFSKFDDLGLFNARSGTFYGYAESGLGSCLVFVKRVEDAPAEKVLEMVTRVRAQLDETHLNEAMAEIRGKSKVAFDPKGISRLADALMAGGMLPEDDFELARFEPYRFTCRQFFWRDLHGTLRRVAQQGNKGEVENAIRQQISDVGARVGLGLEAARKNYSAIQNPRLAFSFNEVKRKFYYQLALEDLIRSVRPTESEVEKIYKERPDLFVEKEHAMAAHIFSPDRRKLERIRKEIAAGANFEEMARKESADDSTAGNGGSLGWVVREPEIDPAILEAVFTQPIGEVGQVVQSDKGFHLVKVTERVPERRVPLAEAKNRLLYRMTMERLASKRKAVLEAEKKKAKIETFPDRVPPSKPEIDLEQPGMGAPGGIPLPGGHPVIPGTKPSGGYH